MLLPELLEEDHWMEVAGGGGWNRLDQPPVWGFHRPAPVGSPRFYLSAGIHGDEPATPAAAYCLMREVQLWTGWEVFMFPVLNPGGLRRGTRDSVEGFDLNRDYLRCRTPEVRSHVAVLQTLPRFDVTVCLHEDWEATGVYLYCLHRNGDVQPARRVLEAMGRVIPVDPAGQIDGREAEQGLIHRRPEDFDGEDWPEAIYLGRHHTDWGFTLETPSSLGIAARVEALCAGVQEILRVFRERMEQ